MTTSMYEKDFYIWIVLTTEALKNEAWENIDLPNLIEEIESMGRAEKAALKSNLVIIMMHLLKWLYQPERCTSSWIYSIVEHRRRINDTFEDSPSLKPYIERLFERCYQKACVDAAAETGLSEEIFPLEPPLTFA